MKCIVSKYNEVKPAHSFYLSKAPTQLYLDIIDAFELWCWKRLLRSLGWKGQAAQGILLLKTHSDLRSNQSIQKEISPEYSL